MLAGLNRKLLDGGINLAKVVDASRGLGTGGCLQKIGNGDGAQQTNDRDYNHDFHQRETAGTIISPGCFHYFLRVVNPDRRII